MNCEQYDGKMRIVVLRGTHIVVLKAYDLAMYSASIDYSPLSESYTHHSLF